MVRAIIPCAGFGTRMNMKPEESKELLIDPVTNKPVIQWTLDLCKECDLAPFIITRKEKVDLIKFCVDNNIEHLIINPEGEWANTICMAKEYYAEDNILLLPDTRFAPAEETISRIKIDLALGATYSIGLHFVTDSSKWCVINRPYGLVEKPISTGFPEWAMGVIGFKGNCGRYLFNVLKTKGRIKELYNTSFQYMDWFKDITRTGKLETWG